MRTPSIQGITRPDWTVMWGDSCSNEERAPHAAGFPRDIERRTPAITSALGGSAISWKNRDGFSGRGGLAAVLGAKRVKAVAVAGARKTEVADVHPEATRVVYAVKRLEMPAHSARALKGMSIGYATASRGGSHHDTRPTPQYAQGYDRRSPDGKPDFAVRSQHFTAVGDSLVLCRFTSERGFDLYLEERYARMVRAVTGWDMTVEELERIINLERLFNVREGVRRKDDVLPWRVMHEPIPAGPSAGMHCPPEELAAMLDRYYALRGWNADGVPTRERLGALGL